MGKKFTYFVTPVVFFLYLNQATTFLFSQEIIPLHSHSAPIASLDFQPGGKYLASSDFFTVRIWDVENKRLHKVISPDWGASASLDFSPDGKYLACAGFGQGITIFETRNFNISSAINDSVYCRLAKFSPNGQFIAYVRKDFDCKVFDFHRGDLLFHISRRRYPISNIDFSPDSKYLALGGEQLEIWDIRNRKLLRTISEISEERGYRYYKDPIFLNNEEVITLWLGLQKWNYRSGKQLVNLDWGEMRFTPGDRLVKSEQGNYIATFPNRGFNDQKDYLLLWNPSLTKILYMHETNIQQGTAIANSNDDRRIALGSVHGTIQVFKLSNSTNDENLNIEDVWTIYPQKPVQTIINLGKHGLVAASYEGNKEERLSQNEIIIWNIERGTPVLKLQEHRERINALCYAPRRDLLFSASSDYTIKIWSLKDESSFHTLVGHTSGVTLLDCSPDEQFLVSCSSNNNETKLLVWDIEKKISLKEFTFHVQIHDLKVGQDNQKVFLACSDSSIKILDIKSGQIDNLMNFETSPFVIEPLPHNNLILSNGLKNRFLMLDIQKKKQLMSFYGTLSKSNVAFVKNAEFMYTINDRQINYWETFRGIKLKESERYNPPLSSIVYNETENVLICGDEYGSIRVYDPEFKQLATFLLLPENNWLTYTPDGYYFGSENSEKLFALKMNNLIYYDIQDFKDAGKLHKPQIIYSRLTGETTSLSNRMSLPIIIIISSSAFLAISVTLILIQRKRKSSANKRMKNLKVKAQELRRYTRDVFLSHASEDKKRYVIPLAKALQRKGISFWLDEAEIKWGDNITEKINEGLKSSRFVIVCISSSFLAKRWPKAELNSALTLENNRNQKVVLPLLVERNKNVLDDYSLILPKLYLEWEIGANKIAKALKELLEAEQSESKIV
jgi:WD40 repeat protein